MKAYSPADDNTLDKQASISNMKMLIGKKHSGHNMSSNVINVLASEEEQNKNNSQLELNRKKISSNQSERNRIWKQDQVAK